MYSTYILANRARCEESNFWLEDGCPSESHIVREKANSK